MRLHGPEQPSGGPILIVGTVYDPNFSPLFVAPLRIPDIVLKETRNTPSSLQGGTVRGIAAGPLISTVTRVEPDRLRWKDRLLPAAVDPSVFRETDEIVYETETIPVLNISIDEGKLDKIFKGENAGALSICNRSITGLDQEVVDENTAEEFVKTRGCYICVGEDLGGHRSNYSFRSRSTVIKSVVDKNVEESTPKFWSM